MMTREEALQLLEDSGEDGDLTEHEDEIFRAIYGHYPNPIDRECSIISQCYAAL